MLPKYGAITATDRKRLVDANILNGCGPQSWKGRGPNWLFKACCFIHDYNYAAGGTEADRRWADWGFYQAMVKDTKRLPWWRQPGARFNAWIFYRMVRWFGKKNFSDVKAKSIDHMIEVHGT
jgi:hypothetical protein